MSDYPRPPRDAEEREAIAAVRGDVADGYVCCRERNPVHGRYGCTRNSGHAGDHVAVYTNPDTVCDRWPSTPAVEAKGACSDFSPPGHAGHWRDWHRGHDCELDPDRHASPSPSPSADDAGEWWERLRVAMQNMPLSWPWVTLEQPDRAAFVQWLRDVRAAGRGK